MDLDLLQSTTPRVLLKVYLASDHASDATGKTVAVTISKNGAVFGNPSAGVVNAAEIGNGWYYVDLSATDTGTLGPLIARGTAALCDNVEKAFNIIPATNRGMTNLDATVSSRLATSGYTVPPSAAVCADGLLGRNIGGGADGGRTVAQSLAFLRNKWTISGGTLTVYAADDVTPLWTSAIVTSAGNPVSSSDPA